MKCAFKGIKIGDVEITLSAEVYHWPDENNQWQFQWEAMDQTFIEALTNVLKPEEYQLVMDEIAKEMIEQYTDKSEKSVR